MKSTRFAKRGLQNDRPHQHLLLQGVLREVPHRPQPHGWGVAQPDVFLRGLQVNQLALPLDGFCCGPLFSPPVKRRAPVNVWRRYVDTKRIGFKGPELWAFRTGFDEAELFAEHTSRSEMRAAFAYTSEMCKTKGFKVI